VALQNKKGVISDGIAMTEAVAITNEDLAVLFSNKNNIIYI
jgi:hypothetical protein